MCCKFPPPVEEETLESYKGPNSKGSFGNDVGDLLDRAHSALLGHCWVKNKPYTKQNKTIFTLHIFCITKGIG